MAAGPQELTGIQIMRGVASVLVVFHHALEVSNGSPRRFSPDWLTTWGAVGVDIFFVISGLIMVYVTFGPGRQPLAPIQFFTRRALRIYPLYWLCCSLVIVLWAAGLFTSKQMSPWDIIVSYALLPGGDRIIGLSWTLTYEMYFYILFAATLGARSATTSVIATTISIGALAFIGTSLTGLGAAQFLVEPVLAEFCLGMILGWLLVHDRLPAIPVFLCVPAIGLTMVAPMVAIPPDTHGIDGVARLLLWGFPAAVVVAFSVYLGRSRIGSIHSLKRLGDASYSIYLTHFFVMLAYGWLLKKTPVAFAFQPVAVLSALAMSIVVGLVVHSRVESPMLRRLAATPNGSFDRRLA